jgi:hypothetical protein
MSVSERETTPHEATVITMKCCGWCLKPLAPRQAICECGAKFDEYLDGLREASGDG